MDAKSSSGLDQLSSAEIERLLKIMGAAQGFLLHDVNGTKGIILTLFHKLQSFFDGETTEEELRELQEFFLMAQSRARALFRGIESHLAGRKVEWSLISYLPYIAEMVTSSLEEYDIEVLPPQGPPVHVVFPQGVLYSIMLELARNAAVHSSGTLIELEWRIKSDGFIISVHDNGAAIAHLLADRFIALGMAQSELFKVGGGLARIGQIVRYSGGLLVVRRSVGLGGAEFAVRLPLSDSPEPSAEEDLVGI